MKKEIFNKLNEFNTITLTELNSKASYFKRIDNKYLLTKNQLKEILEKLMNNFSILEIKWKKIFSYDNIYMDSIDNIFYKQHQNKEKSRTKIRTRLYKDSNLVFFEYKQKINWITHKYRYNIPYKYNWKITPWSQKFYESIWNNIYNNKLPPSISPSINTKYNRITLIDKKWKERLTIDFNIKINNLRNKESKEVDLKNLVIIESKSLVDKCESTEIIQSLWIKKARSCSKYSLWIIYSWLAEKYDTFINTINEIEKIKKEVNSS